MIKLANEEMRVEKLLKPFFFFYSIHLITNDMQEKKTCIIYQQFKNNDGRKIVFFTAPPAGTTVKLPRRTILLSLPPSCLPVVSQSGQRSPLRSSSLH